MVVCVDECPVELKGAAHLADLRLGYDVLFATVGVGCTNAKQSVLFLLPAAVPQVAYGISA